MDHQRLKPLKGASAREQTAFTMKTIKELLAEELTAGDELGEAEPKEAIEAAPSKDVPAQNVEAKAEPAAKVATAAPKPSRPEVPKASSFPRITPASEAPVEAPKSRSFLGRIFKG
ncbi:MAG: hypothetical protein ABJN34_10405 [Litoreibacter sp.]|uniref:hypothetical protein n=1 Tax=Litoreibacter sp. TaxID=1969459 RepID=UPI003298782D